MSVRPHVAIMLGALWMGCGGGSDDPITADWSNDKCFGDQAKPDDIQECQTKLHFDRDLTFTLTDLRKSLPATAVYPRCTTTRLVKGLKYFTDNKGTVTLTGTSTTSTLERSGCANGTDNQGVIPDTRDSVEPAAVSFTIKDNVLSLTSSALAGDYQRQ